MNFHEIPRQKVHVAIVHKHRDDDVFLYNGRSALPAWFSCPSLQLNALHEDELRAIDACYSEQPGRNGDEVAFCLTGLPWMINGATPAFGQAVDGHCWLEQYYARHDSGYQLTGSLIPESVQDEMLRAVSAPAIPEYARYRAGLALEKMGVAGLPMFHCSAYNDTKHYYFYGKRHEHVPGIMLMEFARQAFYAHFYRFSTSSRGTVNLSILSFNCDFRTFLQSNYPIQISVETVSRTVDGPSREQQHLRACLIQRGSVACVINMTGSSVQARLFKKLRDVKTSNGEKFAPIFPEPEVSILLAAGDGEMIEGRIASVTANSLIVKPADTSKFIVVDAGYKFHLVTQHHGIITGEGLSSPCEARAKEGTVAIRVTGWNKGAAEKFREFLKMDCFLVESSGVSEHVGD